MPVLQSYAYVTGEITKKPHKPEKSKKRAPHYSGWQDGPYNTTKGEEALWKAVIAQAMVDALSSNRKQEFIQYKNEAIRWLTTNSKDFLDVCERAGLDANYVRIRAKRAFANPSEWRTEAGQSTRYLERKAMRERKKWEKATPQAADHLIIKGPWKTEDTNA